jgi:hypothetical protein
VSGGAGDPIVVEGLWEAYRKRNRFGWRRRCDVRWALRDVHLAVPAGRLLGVIGGNGSGKTTLLQVVAGVLRPTRGQVRTVGRVASLVDLSAGFHRDLTGRENLLIGGVLLGMSRQEVRRRQDQIVAFSGLDPDRARLAARRLLGRDGAAPRVRAGGRLRARRARRRRGAGRRRRGVPAPVPGAGSTPSAPAAAPWCWCPTTCRSSSRTPTRSRCSTTAPSCTSAPPGEAVSWYRDRRPDVGEVPVAERGLYDPSWRVQAARRRRGA